MYFKIFTKHFHIGVCIPFQVSKEHSVINLNQQVLNPAKTAIVLLGNPGILRVLVQCRPDGQRHSFRGCVDIFCYCLTKISIQAKHSISRIFSLFIVPSPFFVHCPYKGRINWAETVLIVIFGFCHCF